MNDRPKSFDLHRVAATIVSDAGGELVGRTRLQKVAYLATLAGYLDGFAFEYRHYGPFSEQLANSMEIAVGLGLLKEEERRADWGGWYSIYQNPRAAAGDDERKQFLAAAAKIGAIELELAATAAFFSKVEGKPADDAWAETSRRKPDKAAHGRLERAKTAYAELLSLKTRHALPAIA